MIIVGECTYLDKFLNIVLTDVEVFKNNKFFNEKSNNIFNSFVRGIIIVRGNYVNFIAEELS